MNNELRTNRHKLRALFGGIQDRFGCREGVESIILRLDYSIGYICLLNGRLEVAPFPPLLFSAHVDIMVLSADTIKISIIK
jgi:hypothetical protein